MAYESTIAVLADETRRKLFERLAEQPLSVNDLAEGLSVSQPAVSQHLKVLREADLVTFRREGVRRLYSARPEALGELRAYVDQLWRDVLGQFARLEQGDEDR